MQPSKRLLDINSNRIFQTSMRLRQHVKKTIRKFANPTPPWYCLYTSKQYDVTRLAMKKG